MTRLTFTVPAGTELASGRKQAVLTGDVTADVEFNEAQIKQMVFRAVLNKSGKSVDGPVTAKVRRG